MTADIKPQEIKQPEIKQLETKHQEIKLNPHHPDPNQAQTAWLFLCHVPGIEHIDVVTSTQLIVHYQLSIITLAEIEAQLIEHGHKLDSSLPCKIRRAISHYTDETERVNLTSQDVLSKTTRDVFINQYQQGDHGCRDKREKHWRDYS